MPPQRRWRSVGWLVCSMRERGGCGGAGCPLLLLTSAGGFVCGLGEMSSCPFSFLTQTPTHPLHDGARWTRRTHQLPDCGQREDLEQAIVRQFQRWWGGCHHLPHLSLRGGAGLLSLVCPEVVWAWGWGRSGHPACLPGGIQQHCVSATTCRIPACGEGPRTALRGHLAAELLTGAFELQPILACASHAPFRAQRGSRLWLWPCWDSQRPPAPCSPCCCR